MANVNGKTLHEQLQAIDSSFSRAQGMYEKLDEVLRVSKVIYKRCRGVLPFRRQVLNACSLYNEVYSLVAAEVLANLQSAHNRTK